MKRSFPILVITVLTAVIVACSVGTLMEKPGGGADAFQDGPEPLELPADSEDYTRRTFEPFITLYPVQLEIEVRLYAPGPDGEPEQLPPDTAEVSLLLANSSGQRIYEGRTGEDGTARATVYLPAAPEEVTLSLTADGFDERRLVIPDMVRYRKVRRSMAMARTAESFTVRSMEPDFDGDGVPDAYDADFDDAGTAFETGIPAEGELTVAYEDLYGRAEAGDADYNDFIASYTITEYVNGEGTELDGVRFDVTAQKKIAGYDHIFGIRIDTFEGTADVTGAYVDESGSRQTFSREGVSAPLAVELFESTSAAVGESAWFEVDFKEPDHQDIGKEPEELLVDRPPYNPYLYVKNTGADVHLVGEMSLDGDYDPLMFLDGNNFPWGLLVPDSWKAPAETRRIEEYYPDFTAWREDRGESHRDWYLTYVDPDAPPEVTVYAAGYYDDGSNRVAAYWKDDAAGMVELYDAANAEVNDMAVSGGTVYAAGQYINEGGNIAAGYWRDGRLVSLASDETGSDDAAALGIWTDGTTVYASGYVVIGGTKNACYWIDDGLGISRQDLPGSAGGEGTDITLSGGEVYVGGFYDAQSGDYLAYRAAYWNDNTRITVSDDYSQAFGIYVENGTVYTTGFLLSGGARAAYWRGSNDQNILMAGRSIAYEITGDGVNVLVSGSYEHEPGKRAACYWEIGEAGPVDLYKKSGETAEATGIVLDGENVYVSGFTDDGSETAAYWENGILTKLVAGTSSRAAAVAVEISDK